MQVEGGMKALVEEYVERTPRSAALHGQLCAVMPAGQTRTLVHFDPHPVVLTAGEGAAVVDADGNEYVDVLNNYTALVHGHRHPAILEAVGRALDAGTVFPAPHPSQLELAALLQERFPAAARVRFTNSGTEATLLALRLARAATGRRTVAVFEGCYHGSVPEIADGGPDILRLPFGDADAAERALDASVAAVLVEPFLGSGVVPAHPEFLRVLEARAHAVGALFVLDEVQALRNAFHGVHGELDLAPDLVLMGKIVGGGFPVGAVAGTRAVLDLADPRRPDAILHSGTFNGNVVTTTAGAASLRLLDAPAIGRLNAAAALLAARIEATAAHHGVHASVTRSGSIMQVHLATDPASTLDGTAGSRAVAALHLALLLEGVYTAPRGMLNLSTVTSDSALSGIAAAYGRAFARLKDADLLEDGPP